MTELMVQTPGRPAVLDINGGRVFVSVHDEYFRHTYKDFKQRMKLAHPDMNQAKVVSFEIPPVEVPAYLNHHRLSGKPYMVQAHKRAAQRVTYKTPASGGEFRKVKAAYERWLKQEKKWYAQYGLTPPEWGK